MSPRTQALAVLALLAAAGFPCLARARSQDPAPSPAPVELPTARAIVDRFAAETDLAAKLASTRSAYVTGRAAITGHGAEGRFERWAAKPGKSLVRVELPGLGEILTGDDGTTAWSIQPVIGAQILSGAELLQARMQNAYEVALRPNESYESMQTTARKKFAGEECYEIRYVQAPLEGMDPEATRKLRTSYEYYAVESGRLLGMRATSVSPTGPMDVVVRYSMYERFGDVLQARVITQEAAGSQLVVTIESIEYDQVKNEVFALPAAVKERLAKEAPPKPASPEDGGKR